MKLKKNQLFRVFFEPEKSPKTHQESTVKHHSFQCKLPRATATLIRLGSVYYLVIYQLRVSILCPSLWSLNLPLSLSGLPNRSDIFSNTSFKV